MKDTCPICHLDMQWKSRGDRYDVACPRCGEYKLTGTALPLLRNTSLSDRQRANISGWLFENQPFEVHSGNKDWLLSIPTPSFHERANKILLELEKRTEYAGHYITKDISWLGFAWCINEKELDEVLLYLKASLRLSLYNDLEKLNYKILPDGWAYLENLKKVGSDREQGFVAMWFDSDMQKIYDETIAPAIVDAGYKPHRVDQREHNDKIDDEIIAQIKRSRFIVADFTGHRGGVYYEAGFAKGLGLEVVWTCREDDIDNLHFDIRQYNCILWENGKLEEFRRKLSNRLESVLGHGTYQNNMS
jgi:hypothetical protein